MREGLCCQSGYVICCNGRVIMAGTPSMVAHVFDKITRSVEIGYIRAVETSLNDGEVVVGARFELRVFGVVVQAHVHGTQAPRRITETILYAAWLAQVGEGAATHGFMEGAGLLSDFRSGKSPAEGLMAERRRLLSEEARLLGERLDREIAIERETQQ